MSGRVLFIYRAPHAGAPMQSVEAVEVIEGIGLKEDRYALGIGIYSKTKRKIIRHVSLIAIEAIQEANVGRAVPFLPSETRRNLVTEGVDLNSLVGKTFSIGCVRMRGVELCDPCERPSKLTSKPGFNTAFVNRGGLRAEVLNTGRITIGSEIREALST